MKKTDKPALILIDIQQGFDKLEHWGGHRNNPAAEENAGILLALWRKEGLPIFHVQHSSVTPGSPLAPTHPGFDFKKEVQPLPGEPIIQKQVNSAFIGTDLKQRLDDQGITRLVFIGITTDQCVSTSVRMAANFGYDVYIVYDATATFSKPGFDGTVYPAELIHETALASLKDEFATIVTTQQLIEDLAV